MPKSKSVRVNGSLVSVIRTIPNMAAFDHRKLSPEPDQFLGPESFAARELALFSANPNHFIATSWDHPKRITLAKFLTLATSVATLLNCGVISASLARSLSDSIARNYRGR